MGLRIFTRSHLHRDWSCQNRTAEWAGEMDRVLTVRMALRHSTAAQRSGFPGGVSLTGGPVLALAEPHSPPRVQVQFQCNSKYVLICRVSVSGEFGRVQEPR